ncbi:MAG: thiamine pyrophosphate-binding protein, partial [Pseudomonadales bacterium]
MLGADIISKILAKEEIEFVAGFPENRVFDSAAALGIRPLIARSERVATNIADGFSRMTNGKRIGVVAVQEGPGAEAAFAAVAQAYGDASPILMIPGSYDRPLQGIDPYFDVGRSYRAISKLSLVVNDSDALVPAFRRAFGALRRGKGGPVVVSPTHDLLYEDVPDEEPNYRPPKTLRSAADRADVVEIAKVLAGAKRPVVIAGQGILYAEAWDELRELAEFMEIPVMTTLNGKSAFPENHMLALGTGGLSRPRMVDHFLSKSDFVLGIGTSLTVSDYITPIPPKKTIGQITNEPADVGKFYDVEVAAIGDAKLVLRQLIDACISRLGETGRRGELRTGQEIESVKKEYMAEWLPRLTSDDVPISPY